MKTKSVVAIFLLIYIVSYLLFRQTHAEVWTKDNNKYVIFPRQHTWIYYLYRPLTYLDSKVTTIRFHIGPHQ